MKKYIFLPVAALALGFAACDDDDTLGIPVVNPELPTVETSTVTAASSAASVIRLDDYSDGQNFPVATITTGETWPEGYSFGAFAQVDRNENFAEVIEIPAYTDGSTILLNAQEVYTLIQENYTKDPGQFTLNVRLGISAVKGGESIRIGSADTWFATQKINVVPFAPERVYENVYYLATSADGQAWAKEDAVAFVHGSDKSVYDDPAFSLTCKLPADCYWKIVPESVYASGNLASGAIGVAAADAEKTSGTLDLSDAQVAGKAQVAGDAMFEFNIETLSFSYKQAIKNFWVAGTNINGVAWGFAADPNLWTADYVHYYGYAHIEAASYDANAFEFKLSPQAGWGGDFGCSQQLSWNGNVGTGKADGGDNIKVPGEGLYYIELDYSTKDIKVTLIETLGLIGDFNGWAESVAMTAVDNYTYTATVAMSEGNGWKVRANNGWDINLGGDVNSLTPGGDNISCPATGTYEITLHLAPLPWKVDVVKK